VTLPDDVDVIKKRGVLTFKEKKEIIEEVKVLKLTHAEVAQKFQVSRSCVSKIMRNSDEILEQLEENPQYSTRQRKAGFRDPRLERGVELDSKLLLPGFSTPPFASYSIFFSLAGMRMR
jgi:predicted DNA-binding protein YlxM (UPF0122 family)